MQPGAASSEMWLRAEALAWNVPETRKLLVIMTLSSVDRVVQPTGEVQGCRSSQILLRTKARAMLH